MGNFLLPGGNDKNLRESFAWSMSKDEQIQFFDSQMYLPVIPILKIWNFSATMVEYTGLEKNSIKILER